MVCGGDVTAFLQFIDAENTQWAELSNKLLGLISSHASGWLVMHLDGEIPAVLDQTGNLIFGKLKDAEFNPQNTRYLRTDSSFYLPLPVQERAVLFGGGHCAKALVPFLSKVGFRVTVMDNRPEYATPELFPEAETVICGDYCKISDYLTLLPSDYVVIMSNGHAHDLEIQKQVLEHPPYYVGVIGSKSKKDFVNAKLREAGISEEAINSTHTPIGTEIKAVTPEEIAISIAGEMIYERALLRESCGITSHGCPMH